MFACLTVCRICLCLCRCLCLWQAWLRAVLCLAGSYPFHKLRAMLCRVMDILERVAPCHVICAPCYFCSVSCCVILFVFLSVSCRAMSLLLQIRAVPCLARRKHRLGPCLESALGSSVSSRVMRVSVSFRAGPFSCEGRSVSCHVICGGCKFEPCHAMSYHLCAWPLPCLALISFRFLGPCRVV